MVAADTVLGPSSPMLPAYCSGFRGQTANTPLMLLYIVLLACWEAHRDTLGQAMPAVSYRKIWTLPPWSGAGGRAFLSPPLASCSGGTWLGETHPRAGTSTQSEGKSHHLQPRCRAGFLAEWQPAPGTCVSAAASLPEFAGASLSHHSARDKGLIMLMDATRSRLLSWSNSLDPNV